MKIINGREYERRPCGCPHLYIWFNEFWNDELPLPADTYATVLFNSRYNGVVDGRFIRKLYNERGEEVVLRGFRSPMCLLMDYCPEAEGGVRPREGESGSQDGDE